MVSVLEGVYFISSFIENLSHGIFPFSSFDWFTGHGKVCTMDHKYVRCTCQREQPGSSNVAILWVFFNKTVIPLMLAGYEIVMANLAVRTWLAVYHLISNVIIKIIPHYI